MLIELLTDFVGGLIPWPSTDRGAPYPVLGPRQCRAVGSGLAAASGRKPSDRAGLGVVTVGTCVVIGIAGFVLGAFALLRGVRNRALASACVATNAVAIALALQLVWAF